MVAKQTLSHARIVHAFGAERVDDVICGHLSLDQAYRIQLGLVARRCSAGERQLGWKVGLTAEPIQQQFGFHEPVFGCVLDSKPSGHVFGPDDLINPGF